MRAPTLPFPLRVLTLSTLLFLVFFVPQAPAVDLVPDAPQTYVVREGDTLWEISGRFLRDPWRWEEVWQSNTDLANPNLLYPGDVLQLTLVEGEPRIGVTRRGQAPTRSRDGIPVVKLSPKVRVTPLKDAVPVIPIASIAPFLTQPLVADSDEVNRASYVVGFPDEHIVAGLDDAIYVRRIDSAAINDFEVLRPGEALRDPDTNEILGYEAKFIADAALERVGDPAKLRIVRMEHEVSIGDRVIPAARQTGLENFYPRPGPAGTKGQVLSVFNGVTQIGQYDVVVLNRGSRERIQPGHVFEVYIGGTQERDQVRSGLFDWNWRRESPLTTEFWYGSEYSQKGWLENAPDANTPLPLHADIRRERSTYIKPFERAGILMVFRTFDRVSFALVLSANRAMKVGDRFAPPPS